MRQVTVLAYDRKSKKRWVRKMTIPPNEDMWPLCDSLRRSTMARGKPVYALLPNGDWEMWSTDRRDVVFQFQF